MVQLGTVLALSGLAVLVHTTFGVIQYRQVLKLSQEEFQALPAYLVVELAVGTVVALIGGYMASGTLKVISMPPKGRSFDVGALRTDFVSFNNRGRTLQLDIPPLHG